MYNFALINFCSIIFIFMSDIELDGLATHYRNILELIGESPEREGLVKTPQRVAKAMSFLTKGYREDAREILHSARFREKMLADTVSL